jgi:hypothetical protein
MRGWRINNQEAEFNNLVARGTLKSAVLEYDEVSAVGGTLLLRPSALISDVMLSEDELELTLVLDTKNITFRTSYDIEERGEDYYFRIGMSRKAYLYVRESPFSLDENDKKTVTIKRYGENNKFDFDTSKFIGKVLVGYGLINDIGIGLNSSDSSAAMPPEALTVFETDLMREENGDFWLWEGDLSF